MTAGIDEGVDVDHAAHVDQVATADDGDRHDPRSLLQDLAHLPKQGRVLRTLDDRREGAVVVEKEGRTLFIQPLREILDVDELGRDVSGSVMVFARQESHRKTLYQLRRRDEVATPVGFGLLKRARQAVAQARGRCLDPGRGPAGVIEGIRLQPANDAMEPLVFEEGEVEILGVVSGVVRAG